MADGTIEVITGRERRRRWSTEAKLRIVAEAEEPGARLTDVAARHEVYPSLLFTWRRQVREGRLALENSVNFVPVRLLASPQQSAASPARRATEHAREGVSDKTGTGGIEINLPDGTRLYIRHEAQLPLLRPVIEALRR